jgi:hypothetical protein
MASCQDDNKLKRLNEMELRLLTILSAVRRMRQKVKMRSNIEDDETEWTIVLCDSTEDDVK